MLASVSLSPIIYADTYQITDKISQVQALTNVVSLPQCQEIMASHSFQKADNKVGKVTFSPVHYVTDSKLLSNTQLKNHSEMWLNQGKSHLFLNSQWQVVPVYIVTYWDSRHTQGTGYLFNQYCSAVVHAKSILIK